MNSAKGSKEVPTTPLSHEVATFLHRCIERNLALTTLSTYTQVLNRLTEFLHEHHPDVSSFSQVRPAHLQQFRHHLRLRSALSGRELSVRTQAKYLAAVRSLLRYYSLEAHVPVMSRDQVVLPRVAKGPVHPRISPAEVQRLLGQPDTSKPWGARDRAIIAMLATTGIRVSELCALNKRDLRLPSLAQQPTLEVIVPGPASRPIYLDAGTQALVKAYLEMRTDNYPPLFIRHKPGKTRSQEDNQHRLTRQMVDRMLSRYSRAAGLSTVASARDIARLAKS